MRIRYRAPAYEDTRALAHAPTLAHTRRALAHTGAGASAHTLAHPPIRAHTPTRAHRRTPAHAYIYERIHTQAGAQSGDGDGHGGAISSSKTGFLIYGLKVGSGGNRANLACNGAIWGFWDFVG